MNPNDKRKLLKNTGANIKRLRKSKNIEVKEFASTLKVTPQAIGKIENGMVDLNLSRLVEILNLLEVNLAVILDTENDASRNPETNIVIMPNEEDVKSNFINEFKKIANSLISNIKLK